MIPPGRTVCRSPWSVIKPTMPLARCRAVGLRRPVPVRGCQLPQSPGGCLSATSEPRPRDPDLSQRDRIEVLIDVDRDYASYLSLWSSTTAAGCANECMGSAAWDPTVVRGGCRRRRLVDRGMCDPVERVGRASTGRAAVLGDRTATDRTGRRLSVMELSRLRRRSAPKASACSDSRSVVYLRVGKTGPLSRRLR
jgi:hypothetical protein